MPKDVLGNGRGMGQRRTMITIVTLVREEGETLEDEGKEKETKEQSKKIVLGCHSDGSQGGKIAEI